MMSKTEQDYVDRFIEIIDEATTRHKEIDNLKENQYLTMGIALQIFDEYEGVLSYLNEDKQEYFLQWKDWIEKKQSQLYRNHPINYDS